MAHTPTPPGLTSSETDPGPHEGPQGLDSADPHPPEEGDPYDNHHPERAKPNTADIGPNPAKHDGTPPAKPRNVEG